MPLFLLTLWFHLLLLFPYRRLHNTWPGYSSSACPVCSNPGNAALNSVINPFPLTLTRAVGIIQFLEGPNGTKKEQRKGELFHRPLEMGYLPPQNHLFWCPWILAGSYTTDCFSGFWTESELYHGFPGSPLVHNSLWDFLASIFQFL